MIINATAKIYSLKEKSFVKETKCEQLYTQDPRQATEYNIFQAKGYIDLINLGENKELQMSMIKIEKIGVSEWQKSMAQ